MPPKSNPIGPTGKRVAQNLAEFRDRHRLSKADLSRKTGDQGRPVSLDVITKIEMGKRAIDVDDLIVFSRVFDLTPNRIMLTGAADEDSAIELAPDLSVTEAEAWRWVQGLEPLGWTNADHPERQQKARFQAENNPLKPPEITWAEGSAHWDTIYRVVSAMAALCRRSGIAPASLTPVLEDLVGKVLSGPPPEEEPNDAGR